MPRIRMTLATLMAAALAWAVPAGAAAAHPRHHHHRHHHVVCIQPGGPMVPLGGQPATPFRCMIIVR